MQRYRMQDADECVCLMQGAELIAHVSTACMRTAGADLVWSDGVPLLIQHLRVSVAASRGKRCGSSSKPAPLSLRAVDNPADLSIATLYMQCNKKSCAAVYGAAAQTNSFRKRTV